MEMRKFPAGSHFQYLPINTLAQKKTNHSTPSCQQNYSMSFPMCNALLLISGPVKVQWNPCTGPLRHDPLKGTLNRPPHANGDEAN